MPTGKKEPSQRQVERSHSREADEFAQAMSGVTPLRPDPRGRVRRAPSKPAASASEPARKREENEPEPRDDGFVAPGVDRREIRKLRRGEYSPAARLDLHGERATDAVARAAEFLVDSRHRQLRCVCIVHGRGLHSPTGASVVKSRVREHLRASPHVLAWSDAPAEAGGSGAVFVLLRR